MRLPSANPLASSGLTDYPPATGGKMAISSCGWTGVSRPFRWRMSRPLTKTATYWRTWPSFVQDLPVQLRAQRYQPPQQLADKSARRQVYLEVALTGRLPQSRVEPNRRHR